MKKLIRTETAKLIRGYNFRDWKITVAEEGFTSDNLIYSFYLTGLSTTMFMFGVEKKTMEETGHTFESLILQNLEEQISYFTENYNEGYELENPFED